MDVELAALSELREKPAGTLRITAIEYAADTILMPALAKLLPKYPDIKVEVITDYGLSNIVAERYDAGIRLGEQVANDMVAVRIGPDFRMVVVGSPTYFSSRKRPRTPQDLTGHNCINLRLPTYGGIYAWEFEKNGRELNVRVDGQLVFNGVASMLNAALNGLGLGGCRKIGSDRRRRRAPCQSPLRLVRAVLRLPSLLPEPSPALTGACRSGRCAALSWMSGRHSLSSSRTSDLSAVARRAKAEAIISPRKEMRNSPGRPREAGTHTPRPLL